MSNTVMVHGKEVISTINSYRAWRQITKRNSFLDINLHDSNGYCEDCEGQGFIIEKNFGKILCMCEMKHIEEDLLVPNRSCYESLCEPKEFETYVPWGEYKTAQEVKSFLKEAIKWTESPVNWLTITGNNGSGKSHILSAMNTLLTPWSIYLSLPDLEQLYFEAMKEENGLQYLVERLSSHPILLLDDMGADYGGKFARSVSQKIIDARYRFYSEFPTVVATNLNATDLKIYDRRIGDRVYDFSKNNIVFLIDIPSYRKEGIEGIK
jgi:DNA replication protein DnaC